MEAFLFRRFYSGLSEPVTGQGESRASHRIHEIDSVNGRIDPIDSTDPIADPHKDSKTLIWVVLGRMERLDVWGMTPTV